VLISVDDEQVLGIDGTVAAGKLDALVLAGWWMAIPGSRSLDEMSLALGRILTPRCLSKSQPPAPNALTTGGKETSRSPMVCDRSTGSRGG